mgnify:CR=1 FL=1
MVRPINWAVVKRAYMVISMPGAVRNHARKGEVMDYRLCVTLVSAAQMLPCYLIMWRGREDVKKVYNQTY